MTGRYWKNLSSFRFEDRTASTGFAPEQHLWAVDGLFRRASRPARWANWKPAARFESQPGLTPQHPSKNTPYFADAIFADLDNDGALDVVVLNRSESLNPRSFLLMGKGDGTSEIKPTTFSGLDSSGISGEAADLNGDGLLDLVFAADPANKRWQRARRARTIRKQGLLELGRARSKAKPLAPPDLHRPDRRRTHRRTSRTHRRRPQAVSLDSQ